MASLIGTRHNDLLQWLANDWRANGPPVCFVDGFPGVGKSEVRRQLQQRLGDDNVPAVSIDVPQPGVSQVDDLVLDLGQEFQSAGITDLADAVDRGMNSADMLGVFEGLLHRPIVVVWDEFQNGLDEQTGEPLPVFRSMFDRVARRPNRPGRLLLLTSRKPTEGRWCGAHAFRDLPGLSSADGEVLLDDLLRQTSREEAVAPQRRADVVAWVGGNPRAMRMVVAALAAAQLDDLIGVQPELWEARDRQVSADLVRKLERELLDKVVAALGPAERLLLRGLSVYRKPVQREALERLVPAANVLAVCEALVSRFLLDHRLGWYEPNPVVREVERLALRDAPAEWQRLHGLAADHCARHFRAKDLVGGGRLGGHFVEARYHLVQAGRADDLAAIAQRFAEHVRSEIHAVSPVPRDPRERDERIATLSGLLAQPGPKGLEYHLARCLDSRRLPGDAPRALDHARRATGAHAPADAWVLRIRLEGEVAGLDAAVAVARQGVRQVSSQQNLFALYQVCADLLANGGRLPEAIRWLKEGLGKVPPDKSLSSLYRSCAELLARQGKADEAVALLKEGLGKVPPDKNLFSLYLSCAELLARQGKGEEAFELLRQGMLAIPFGRFNQHRVSESAILQAAGANRPDWIRTLIESGTARGLGRQQAALAEVVLRQMEGDWVGAAEIAKAARGGFATYFPLAMQEAFSRLCAGDPLGAQAALDQRPGGVEHSRGSPVTWLACFVALRRGDAEAATGLYATYLGDEGGDALPSEADLLRIWDGPWPLSTPHPAYYHSTLPPSLTGLAEPVTRPHGGISVFAGRLLVERAAARGEEGGGSPPEDDAATQPPRIAPGLPKVLGFLAIATEWDPAHGGLSTFNRELCRALAGLGHRVVCLVPEASPEERESARAAGVTLACAPATDDPSPYACLYRRPVLPEGFEPDVVVGHGRITGEHARAQVSDAFGRAARVHFVHTAPREIEWLKAKSDAGLSAEERTEQEIELCRGARLVVAVGPHLYDEIVTLLQARGWHEPVHRFDPGVAAQGGPRSPPPKILCLVLGRAEDCELKGLDIAARAVALLPHPQPRPFASQPQLVVRGAPADQVDRLRDKLIEIADTPGTDIYVSPYTADAERIAEELRRSSLLLMPSRKEGFGLVALEAISAGTPILVSDQSGVAKLLVEKLPADQVPLFLVRTTGELATDAAEWARMIETVLRDRNAAFARAATLRDTLAAKLTWAAAAEALVGALRQEVLAAS